ncbi:MAG: hypothetical protein ACNA7V_04085 [Bacteroidales bacterium]
MGEGFVVLNDLPDSRLMGHLFGKDKRTISEHVVNIFKEGELDENSVVRKFRTTTQHGAIAVKQVGQFE